LQAHSKPLMIDSISYCSILTENVYKCYSPELYELVAHVLYYGTGQSMIFYSLYLIH